MPGAHLERKNRPAIIVSNDANNAFSPVYEVVFLTSSPRRDLPTHVTIRSAEQPSVALCEQVQSVGKEALQRYVGHCTAAEMEAIDCALMISLGLSEPYFTPAQPTIEYEEEEIDEDDWTLQELTFESAEITELRMKCELYEKLYNDLLTKIIK